MTAVKRGATLEIQLGTAPRECQRGNKHEEKLQASAEVRGARVDGTHEGTWEGEWGASVVVERKGKGAVAGGFNMPWV